MTITYPKILEETVFEYVQKLSPRKKSGSTYSKTLEDSSLKFFSKGVSELSDLFTSDRQLLKPNYLSQPAFRTAYLLYFLPINFAKAYFVFSQIPESFWQKKQFRLLDLGSGPATASLAFLELARQKAPEAEFEIQLVDINANILQDGRTLLQAFADKQNPSLKLNIQTSNQDIRRFHWKGNYDLVVLNHVLNEWVRLAAHERAEWLESHLSQHLPQSGLVAVLEPALKRPTRELMALRDHLLESERLSVLGPCLHQNFCPMLKATKNDWCHFYLDWKEPEYLKKIDRWIGNQNHFLKVSYLLSGWENFWKQRNLYADNRFRIVSNRMQTRGKTELVLCGPKGRWKLTQLDRDRSEQSQILASVRRGDCLSIPSFSSSTIEINAPLRLPKKVIISKV